MEDASGGWSAAAMALHLDVQVHLLLIVVGLAFPADRSLSFEDNRVDAFGFQSRGSCQPGRTSAYDTYGRFWRPGGQSQGRRPEMCKCK